MTWDDTLLSINLSAFIGVFALDEANLLAQVARKPIVSLFSPLGSAMLALNNGDRAPGGHPHQPPVLRR